MANLLHYEVKQGHRYGDGDGTSEVESSHRNGTLFLRGGYLFLESCLKIRHDTVVYGAVRAICYLPRVDG